MTVSAWLWFLTRTTDCRIFQEKTVPEIIEDVFADHKMAVFDESSPRRTASASTVSNTSNAQYRINLHGRYSHSRRYLSAAMPDAGLCVEIIESAVLRREGGLPVKGLVVTARRFAQAAVAKETRR